MYWKLVICLHKLSSRSTKEPIVSLVISFLISNKMTILAFSNVALRAMSRKRLNSLLEEDPQPSDMLFDMDIPEPLSWSANRYNFFLSSSSAISKSSLANSIDNCQMRRSWNLNLAMVLCPFRLLQSSTGAPAIFLTLCPMLYAFWILCLVKVFIIPRFIGKRTFFWEGVRKGVRCQCLASSNEDWGLNAGRIALVWIPDIRWLRIPGWRL